MFLIELLPVLVLLAAGTGMAVVAIDAVLDAQRAVSRLSNRYAVFNDMLNQLQADVRAAERMELRTVATAEQPDDSTMNVSEDGSTEQLDGERPVGPAVVLVLEIGSDKWVYTFEEDRVTRAALGEAGGGAKDWAMKDARASVSLEGRSPSGPEPQTGRLLHLTVEWGPGSREVFEPSRRFDATLRCSGEVRCE